MVNTTFLNAVCTARTALFSPGNRPERVEKALLGAADVVIADLEDAVAVEDKATARANVVNILNSPVAGAHGLVVRINEPSSPAGHDDLRALSGIGADARTRLAVMVAKTQTTADVDAVAQELGADTPVIALIESADGVLNAPGIARHPSVVRLALGAIDLAAELGCEVESETTHHVRAHLVLVSAAAGIAGPIESPCPNFRDPTAVESVARSARRNGFTGILCIHPAQLEPAAGSFAPSAEDIAWARKVITAADGASAIDGQMIDRPVILRAQAVLAAAGEG